jgi:hypothetical protein
LILMMFPAHLQKKSSNKNNGILVRRILLTLSSKKRGLKIVNKTVRAKIIVLVTTRWNFRPSIKPEEWPLQSILTPLKAVAVR